MADMAWAVTEVGADCNGRTRRPASDGMVAAGAETERAEELAADTEPLRAAGERER